MAKALRRCVGVDLGSRCIKVADLALTKTGVVINKLASAEIDFPPNMPQDEREVETAKALRALLKSSKISASAAVFAVPGQQVFIRRWRLPNTNPERMRRIITYESDQLIPFPADQSLRRHQIVVGEGDEEAEVLLSAMKREHSEQFMRMVGKTGLKPASIGVDSLALHNYYRFLDTPFVSPEDRKKQAKEAGKTAKKDEDAQADEQDDKKAKKKGGLGGFFKRKSKKGEEDEAQDEIPADKEQAPQSDEAFDDEFGDDFEFQEIVGYVDIGARTMDLSIPKLDGGSSLGFSRSVPMAGNAMTMAVAKAKGLNDFASAEKVKRERGVIISADDEAEGVTGDTDLEVAGAVKSVVDRLIIELRRSLDFFISQPDGVVVDKIALSGGVAALPGLTAYMEERLGLPIEVTSELAEGPLEFDEATESESLTRHLVAIGLAIGGLEYGEITIDFLPDELQLIRAMKKKAPILIAMLVAIGASIGMSTQVGTGRTQAYRDTVAFGIQPLLGQDRSDEIDAVEGERMGLDGSFGQIQTAFGPIKNDYWFDFLKYVWSCRPENVVITHLEFGGAGQVFVKGYAVDDASPSAFVRALSGDARIVKKAELVLTFPIMSGTFQVFNTNTTYFEIKAIVMRTTRMVTPPLVPFVADQSGGGPSEYDDEEDYEDEDGAMIEQYR